MSEILYESAVNSDSPDTYQGYEKIQIVQYDNAQKSLHAYGVNEQGRKHLPGVLSAYGMNGSRTSKEFKLYQEDPDKWHRERQEPYLQSRNLPYFGEQAPYKEPIFEVDGVKVVRAEDLTLNDEDEQHRRQELLSVTQERDQLKIKLGVATDEISAMGEENQRREQVHKEELEAANRKAKLAETELAAIKESGRTPEKNPPSSRLGRAWYGASGWIGWNLTGRRAYSRLTRPSLNEEEVITEYDPADRRFGAGVVLGAAAVGTTALITWLLTRHSGHDYNNELNQIVNQNKTIINNQNHEINSLIQTVNHQTTAVQGLTKALNKDTNSIHNLAQQVAGLKAAEAKEHIVHGASAANEIFVNPGHGYTQEIQDSFPGKNGSQYYEAYKVALHKFGRNFIQGIPKYRMTDGNWGLGRSGAAHWAPKVHEFLKNYFAPLG
jgi:hypothetical protein